MLRTLFAVLAATASAHAAITAESKITAVTVYPDRAIVTREATVAIPSAGETDVSFPRVSGVLDEDSVQVSGSGEADATITSVSFAREEVPAQIDPNLTKLQRSIDALTERQQELLDEQKTLHTKSAVLDRLIAAALPAPTKDTPAIDYASVGKLSAYVADQQMAISGQNRRLAVGLRQVTAQLQAAQAELKAFHPGQATVYTTVAVKLAAGAGTLRLQLKYEVPHAGWHPFYDARAFPKGKKVHFTYSGIVEQETGEDWDGVKLTLSTAQPALGDGPGRLTPWRLSLPDNRPQRPMPSNTAMNQPMDNGLTSRGAEMVQLSPFEVQTAKATVQHGATSASFNILGTASIATGAEPQVEPIAEFDLEATPAYTATPKLIPAVFLTMHATHRSELPLLPGQIHLFLEHAFVATGSIELTLPGDPLDLAFGADQDVTVKRVLTHRYSQGAGLLSRHQRGTIEYQTTIQNHKATPVALTVLDQAPISANAKIEVKLLAPSESEAKPDADGMLKWQLNLAPGEKRVLTLRFSIDAPNDAPVQGLDLN